MNVALTEQVPTGLNDALLRSAERVALGQIVPLEPVLDRLRASIARMQARRDGEQATTEL